MVIECTLEEANFLVFVLHQAKQSTTPPIPRKEICENLIKRINTPSVKDWVYRVNHNLAV